MNLSIKILPLALSITIWYKFLKKPESPLLTLIKKYLPDVKKFQDELTADILKDVFKIIGLYIAISKVIK